MTQNEILLAETKDQIRRLATTCDPQEVRLILLAHQELEAEELQKHIARENS